MGIKTVVFASRAERANFYKLSRTWADKYRIYPNLPFLSVFNTTDLIDFTDVRNPIHIHLSETDINRLKKTSIDYTLCDSSDAPILCIEFDGLQDGFNAGTTYYPERLVKRASVWRRLITELKLRVAFGSTFPFFVVGYTHFRDLSPETRLSIVDGIIGEVVSIRETQSRLSKGFDSMEVGYSQDEFDALPKSLRHELIQNWVFDIEIMEEFGHNPVSRRRAQLQNDVEVESWSVQSLEYPAPIEPPATEERARELQSAILYGSRVTLRTKDHGDIAREAWLPNFSAPAYSGLGICEDIAALLALEHLSRLRTGSA